MHKIYVIEQKSKRGFKGVLIHYGYFSDINQAQDKCDEWNESEDTVGPERIELVVQEIRPDKPRIHYTQQK
jgi:hypothetical protein